jgi:hypothetical protein
MVHSTEPIASRASGPLSASNITAKASVFEGYSGYADVVGRSCVTARGGYMKKACMSLRSHLMLGMAVCCAAAVAAKAGTGIFINGTELTRRQALAIVALYQRLPPPAHYWYDSRSGAWGFEGHETAGFILPGHNFSPLSPEASHGNTEVFINGRELNLAEAASLQRIFGAVYKGRWWLDGRTGNWGAEGNPIPLGNILSVLRAQTKSQGDHFWSSSTAAGNWDGDCGYINVSGDIQGLGSCR